MKKLLTIVCLIILAAMLLGTPSYAEDSDGNWAFNLAPLYLWGVTIDGTQTLGTNTVPVELEFKDIFGNLQAIFTIHFEGMWKNRWGFLIDYNYIDLGGTQPVPVGADLDVDFKVNMGELAGTYRFGLDAHNLDIIYGIRYTDMKTKVKVKGGPTLTNSNRDWVDPIIGGRWWWNFAEKWALILRGDIGGFGVGSDFTWNAVGFIDWQPFKYVSFVGGYRALYQDFKEGSGSNRFEYDATIHGPLIGVNIRW